MSAKYFDNIAVDSVPEWGLLAPFRWDSADLAHWYQLLLDHFGPSDANVKFLAAWNNAPFYDTLRLQASSDSTFQALAQANNLFTSADKVAQALEAAPGNLLSFVSFLTSPMFLYILLGGVGIFLFFYVKKNLKG